MTLSITKVVPEILKETPGRKMTAREIAQQIMARYPNEVEEKRRRSSNRKIPLDSDAAMLQQIVAEIGAQRLAIQKKEPGIKTTAGRPRRYYFTEKPDEEDAAEADIAEAAAGGETLSEADLYPLFGDYLLTELHVLSLRIDEKRSSNARGKGANRWLYPDVVGMENLGRTWHREVLDCVREYHDKKTRLWSFEVKLRLNRATVREAYFQAVSNSSWANLGYLVAAEIEASDTLDELRMLSGLHGIGLIRLDAENVTESEIMIPARERTEIDWNIASRLAGENADFLKYIRLIRQFYQTGDPREKDWHRPHATSRAHAVSPRLRTEPAPASRRRGLASLGPCAACCCPPNAPRSLRATANGVTPPAKEMSFAARSHRNSRRPRPVRLRNGCPAPDRPPPRRAGAAGLSGRAFAG